MADFPALTIQSGIQTQLQSTNYLQAGLGIKPRGNTDFEIYAQGSNTIKLFNNTQVQANFNLTMAAGTGAADFSNGSGIFKTSTGAVTIGPGAVTVSGAATFSAAGTALSVTNDAAISGALSVSGNTTLSGTIASIDSARVQIADNHLYINNGYTTASGQTGGLVVNYLPTATNTTVNGVYTAGVAATSNPTVVTTGSGTFAASDIIQISGSTKNNGLYEVLTHSGTTLTIRGIGVTATVEDFTDNQFTAGASDGAAIRKVTISVIRAGTDGIWEMGASATTPVTFTDISTGGSATLQSAYTNGNTITTSAGSGNVTIAGDQDFVLSGTVDANWSTTGGFTASSMTGAVNLTTTSTMTMRGGGVSVFGDDTGIFSFNGTGALSTSGLTSASITPSGAITLTAGAASVWSTSSGALTITSAAAATWSTAAGALSLTSAAAATWKTSAGLLTIEGAAGVQLNGATGTSYATVVSNAITVQSGITLATTGSGNINLPNNGSARFNIEGAAVSANVTAANLGTLTAGSASNADTLHTHTAVTASAVGMSGTANATVDTGAPVTITNSGGVPRITHADANGAGDLPNVVGINLTGTTAGNSVTVIVSGRVSTPDAVWDAVPAVTDVSKRVYLSENIGKLTLTAPSTTGSTIVRVGFVAQGGTGAAQVLVNVGEPTVL